MQIAKSVIDILEWEAMKHCSPQVITIVSPDKTSVAVTADECCRASAPKGRHHSGGATRALL